MVISPADWESYAQNTSSIIIRAHYFFTVWRNYVLLLHGLNIPQGTLLEIGSSTGQNSLRLAKKYGLHPTLVDTSKLALIYAKQVFIKHKIYPNIVLRDALNLSLKQRFDFVHSHGLLEHFKKHTQKMVFQNHVKFVRPGGWLICWVPTPDVFYRLNRWYLERTSQWIFGYEKPLLLRDFVALFHQEGLQIRKIRHPPGWLGIAAQTAN